MSLVVFLSCLLSLVPNVRAAGASFVVTTTDRQLRDVPRASRGAELLGIPYAQPPVGELRWHEPIAAHCNGVREAGTFGARGFCANLLLPLLENL